MSLISVALGLAEFVPAIASYFAGDNGEKVADEVVGLAKRVTGLESPEAVLEQLKNDKELQRQLKIELFNHRKSLELIAFKDRDSARKLQSESIKSSGWLARNFLYLYSLLLTFFVLSYISAISFFVIPEDSRRWVDTVLGFLLGSLLSSVIGFFYGSSAGSKVKTLHMSKNK